MANIEFKNITEYQKYLRTQHLTYLNEGSEAKCYVSIVDNLVYKNLVDSTYVKYLYFSDEVITKEQVNLPSFAFPIDLHTHQNIVWGYTSEFISPDQLSGKCLISKREFLKINFNYLKKALEVLRKDTEILSGKNILINDLPFNLLFTGTRFIAIDTLSYLRMEENTLYDNLESINYAITSVFDLWIQNMGLENIREKDINTYLNEVETLQRQLKNNDL